VKLQVYKATLFVLGVLCVLRQCNQLQQQKHKYSASRIQKLGATLPVLGRAVRPETTQPSVVAQLARVKLLMLFAGEGGAGTWSDGKLTTKVGRNSDPVRRVLHTLYTFGAPQVQ